MYSYKNGVLRMVLWAYSSKRGEFYRFTVTVRVSVTTKVRDYTGE